MNDPYIVLGVSRYSTDEEITKAYRELAKKYHPDNYVNSPLASYATEKMQEINEAYNMIRKNKKGAADSNSNSYNTTNYNYSTSSSYNYGYGNNTYANNAYGNNNNNSNNAYTNNNNNNNYNTSNNGYANGGTKYRDVRFMIQNGRLADADQILSGIPTANRDAEWYFLKGTILYRKGWTEQASQNFEQAIAMDPSNQEYQAAYNQMNARRSGSYGGYNTNPNQNPNSKDCSSCDVCTTLLCMDCCCECVGCDFISCC